jgi:hypothetical protein
MSRVHTKLVPTTEQQLVKSEIIQESDQEDVLFKAMELTGFQADNPDQGKQKLCRQKKDHFACHHVMFTSCFGPLISILKYGDFSISWIMKMSWIHDIFWLKVGEKIHLNCDRKNDHFASSSKLLNIYFCFSDLLGSIVLVDKARNPPIKHLVKVKKSSDGGKVHLCNFCTKEFKKPSDLCRHLRLHTLDFPFKCRLCPRRFSVKSTLNGHMKIHTGGRDQICPLCLKRFPTSSALKLHQKTHKQPKTGADEADEVELGELGSVACPLIKATTKSCLTHKSRPNSLANGLAMFLKHPFPWSRSSWQWWVSKETAVLLQLAMLRAALVYHTAPWGNEDAIVGEKL